ncbi:MAG: radical SAM protein, partial [Acidimicrobiaceae bacterium]|nr:radical SAM protein [Acidimicrobiaceae bacterium]
MPNNAIIRHYVLQRKQGEWHGPVHHDVWKDYQAGDKIQFFADMKEILLNTDLVKFTGGEPMMNAGILDFIEWMVLQKLSHGLRLKIITNGTKLNQDLLNFSKHFRSFDIAVSVDGVFDVDEYQRVGTDFWEVDHNIDVL